MLDDPSSLDGECLMALQHADWDAWFDMQNPQLPLFYVRGRVTIPALPLQEGGYLVTKRAALYKLRTEAQGTVLVLELRPSQEWAYTPPPQDVSLLAPYDVQPAGAAEAAYHTVAVYYQQTCLTHIDVQHFP